MTSKTKKRIASVDEYLAGIDRWREETAALRKMLLDCGLEEAVKWDKPCYACEGRNVVLIQGFRSYCALLFFKGHLLKDPGGMLVKTGPNTRVGRQIRFTGMDDVRRMIGSAANCVREGIEIEKAGGGADSTTDGESGVPEHPEELRRILRERPELNAAFEALTPGRKRGYLFHFTGAKQAKTREARIEKYAKQIMEGRGMHDPPGPRTRKAPRFASVADYAEKQGAVKGKTLMGVVEFILKEFPELEAKIAWNVPTIHRGGKYVAGIDAAKNHLTFSAFSAEVIAEYKERLAGYVMFKNCFQVPVDWAIDKGLLRDLVQARLRELDR